MEIRANKLFTGADLYCFCKSMSANTHSNDTIFVTATLHPAKFDGFV